MVELKPGQVIVILKEPGEKDVSGTFNTFLQGDAKGKHVCYVLPNGRIATTGAKFKVFYGEVDAEPYLKGKHYAVLETVDALSPGQLAVIQECHNQLMASGIKRFYGLVEYPKLIGLELVTGFVSKTGKHPTTKAPGFFICSQATGYPLWKADIKVGKMFGKEDYTALKPDDFWTEARVTQEYMETGFLNRVKKPCHFLRVVYLST